MKAIKNAILPIIIGLFLFDFIFSIAIADVTYTYTGKKFTQVSGTYKTSQKITGSFSLPIPLLPSTIYNPINLPVFSFSDGDNKLSDRNISVFSNGYLETDANGNIKYWSLVFSKYEPDPPKVFGRVRSILTSNTNVSQIGQIPSFDLGSIGICLEVMGSLCTLSNWGNFDFGNSFNVGTWKISTDNAGPTLPSVLISKGFGLLSWYNSFLGKVKIYTVALSPSYLYCSAVPTIYNPGCSVVVLGTAGIALYEGYQVTKIVFDPPDPLYSEIFQPRQYQALTLDSSSGLPQELIDAANTAFRDRTELASLLEAWRVTLERYTAAQDANDQYNMLRQVAALDDYIIQTSRLATLVQQSFNELLDQLEALTGPVQISPDQMQEAMNNLAVNGFDDLVLERLSSFGLGSAETEELRSILLQSPPFSDSVDFYSFMRSTEGGYGELSAITRYVLEDNSLNQPPIALCQNRTVLANHSCQADASVDNGSYDPDGDPITLTQAPSGPYVLGNTDVTLAVMDSNATSASCAATVTVVDTTPPTITSVTASPNTLWPPNHKMVSVKITAITSDNCTVTPACTITSVTSNEPENGLGTGDTAPDWQITGNLTVNLRAERSGTGTGRVYTVNGACMDAAGNSAPWSTTVTVPHDRGRNR